MKTLLLVTVLTLTSCGVAEDLRSHCGSDIEMGCNAVFGYKNTDQDQEIENLKKKNAEQDAKIADLQNQINNNYSFANSLQSELFDVMNQINDINSDIANLQNTVTVNNNTVQSQLAVLNNSLNSLTTNQTLLQNQINSVQANVTTLMAQMVNLQQNQSVTSIVDPCGDGPGFDEVLLKMSNGKYVAYFQQGNNRMLTVLQNNTTYQTTDQQGCTFSLNSTGVISW